MNIQGKLHEVFDENQVSEKFRNRKFVIEYADNPQYPEYIQFELVQDKTDLIESYSIGQHVDVSFNLKGRKWTNPQGVDSYFNSLQAWRIQPLSASSQSAPVTVEDDKTGGLPF